jgi:hypothetical protein
LANTVTNSETTMSLAFRTSPTGGQLTPFLLTIRSTSSKDTGYQHRSETSTGWDSKAAVSSEPARWLVIEWLVMYASGQPLSFFSNYWSIPPGGHLR